MKNSALFSGTTETNTPSTGIPSASPDGIPVPGIWVDNVLQVMLSDMLMHGSALCVNFVTYYLLYE